MRLLHHQERLDNANGITLRNLHQIVSRPEDFGLKRYGSEGGHPLSAQGMSGHVHEPR